MQHTRKLGEFNEQIQNHINQENEYETYLNNQINEYHNNASMIHAPLIWDKKKQMK